MPYILQRVQRKAAGAFLTDFHEGGGIDSNVDTVMCSHCGMHWTPEPGSGRDRGWCMSCSGFTCGKEHCETHCVPTERMIERIELIGLMERQRERNLQEIRGY